MKKIMPLFLFLTACAATPAHQGPVHTSWKRSSPETQAIPLGPQATAAMQRQLAACEYETAKAMAGNRPNLTNNRLSNIWERDAFQRRQASQRDEMILLCMEANGWSLVSVTRR